MGSPETSQGGVVCKTLKQTPHIYVIFSIKV